MCKKLWEKSYHTVFRNCICLSGLSKIHYYGVCVCVRACVCACMHACWWCSVTALPPLRGQYLQFILSCKITLSHSASPFLPPPVSSPIHPLSTSLPTACHIYCMSEWLSVIKANYGLFWACRASCGSNTLRATRANPSLPPYVCSPLYLSIPRASTTCSISFYTQLLPPVGMWGNLNLMWCQP